MDKTTLLAVHDYSRARLLGILDAIEKSGANVGDVLAWRPGPGRAHVGWQAMHCAATHDRYLNVALLNSKALDEALVADFGGGSTPSDQKVPTLSEIRAQLEKHYANVRKFIESAAPGDFDKKHKLANGNERSVGESLLLLAWHEAHHQGQIHLTWNLYKAAHPSA